jgi:hypothetical protein
MEELNGLRLTEKEIIYVTQTPYRFHQFQKKEHASLVLCSPVGMSSCSCVIPWEPSRAMKPLRICFPPMVSQLVPRGVWHSSRSFNSWKT